MGNKREIFDPKTVCKVVSKDGMHFLVMPDGTEVPRMVWSRVYSGSANSECSTDYIIAKFWVNIE